MHFYRLSRIALVSAITIGLSGCGGGFGSGGLGGVFGNRGAVTSDAKLAGRQATEAQADALAKAKGEDTQKTNIWSLFGQKDNPNTTVEVNKYLWKASLEVLNFLPIESVDPFTGVIVTGYGTPPGGGRSVRATIYVQDPALDARSLKIAMQGKGGGAVSPETIRAIEDAILTRARQLRIQDTKL
jgi:hypothetical protein